LDGCRVHDLVLDLIRSLSSEENFVTVLTDMDGTPLPNIIRRLSVQNVKESRVIAQVTKSLQHARSVVVFPSAGVLVPALGICRVLRVLDLEDCDLSHDDSIKFLGNLYHLRYLGLCSAHIFELPEEIGNLQFLQTLDLRDNDIYSSLPLSVVQLRNLMSLDIDSHTTVPNGIVGNLTCVEHLSWLCINDSNIKILDELGQLTELRQLRIELSKWNTKRLDCVWNSKLSGCISKLQKIQELEIGLMSGYRIMGGLDAWVAPPSLRLLFFNTAGLCGPITSLRSQRVGHQCEGATSG
jgi:Leucine-rich repeat (LRR) protein